MLTAQLSLDLFQDTWESGKGAGKADSVDQETGEFKPQSKVNLSSLTDGQQGHNRFPLAEKHKPSPGKGPWVFTIFVEIRKRTSDTKTDKSNFHDVNIISLLSFALFRIHTSMALDMGKD